ncbi:MAG TPA: prolyl oligopeptidase family serine peptidase [bacterium]|nr:prolyl oligopeptidase family serine peptidase [bacterium]
MEMHIREYNSSVDKNLKLTDEFHVPSKPKPLCLFFHGWHMTAAASRLQKGTIEPLVDEFFLVNVDMRGRGGSSGKPDASGHELIDGLDGLEYARENWGDRISPRGLYAVGGSGGGGNVLALAGKSPDIFSAAVSWAGISDYALLYSLDARGRIRDEMEEKGWIGGSPDTNPEGYRSRSGVCIIENVFTRLLAIQGRKDATVPVILAEQYEARAAELKKDNIKVVYNDMGHSSMEWPLAMCHLKQHAKLPEIPGKGRLLVYSFLALRSFWIILESPSDMGYADYVLDSGGNLESLSFHRTYSMREESDCRIRLFSTVRELEVRDGAGKKLVYGCEVKEPGRNIDFSFRCKGDFTLRVQA